MSRIGNKVIVLPAGVELTNNDNVVTVKGPKGELTREFSKDIEIRVEGTEVTLHRPNDSKEMKTIHGTTRALLNNMVIGVSEGSRKNLKCVGLVTVHNFKETNLFWLLVNHIQTKLKLQKELLLNFQTQRLSLSAEFQKKKLVKQLLTYVAFVHQNHTKVKVSVTLANMFVLKKVKLVNNVEWLIFNHQPHCQLCA